MTSSSASRSAKHMPGKAHAEEGVVILDGPDGVAVTMTAYSASETGKSLLEAARVAEEQAGRASFEPE